MPKVSVVIPCYNHGVFLPETLESLQLQTVRDFEVIVVDDGSTDAVTVNFLDSLDSRGVRVIRTVNRGVSAARNRGISESNGEYILPLDSDDKIAPTYLEKAAAVLDKNPQVGVVYPERVLFGEREGVDSLPAYDQRAMLIDNLIYPAALFRKSDWERAGGYNERMVHGWEDWDFWLAITRLQVEVVKLPETLFYYRVRSSSRDHSLSFCRKLWMYLHMVWRHRIYYLRHLPYVVCNLFRTHVLRRGD